MIIVLPYTVVMDSMLKVDFVRGAAFRVASASMSIRRR